MDGGPQIAQPPRLGQIRRPLLAAVCAALFLVGVIAPLFGTLLPALSTRLQLTAKDGGRLASAQAVGVMVAGLVTGTLAEASSLKAVLVGGLALVAAVLVAVPSVTSSGGAFASFSLLGLSSGILVTAANKLASDFGREQRAWVLNLANVYFSLGGLLTPALAAHLVGSNALRASYWVATMAVLVLVAHIVTAIPAAPPRAANRRWIFGSDLHLAGRLVLLLLALLNFLYLSCELACWTWLPKYLESRGVPPKRALDWFVGFALGLLAGRLAGTVLARRLSAWSLTLACSILMVASSLGLLYASVWWLRASVFCTGAAMGPVFASEMAMTGENFAHRTTTTVGIVITSGWLGVAFSSRLIAALAGHPAQLGHGLSVLPVFSLAMVAALFALRRVSGAVASSASTCLCSRIRMRS